MKTIFRFVSFGVLLAAFIGAGNIIGFAQNPCEDADGITALDTKIRDLIAKRTLADVKARIDPSKQFLEKYGSCENTKEFAEYLKTNIPNWEKRVKDGEAAAAFDALAARFNNALKTRNWDELYAAGKEILALKPDELRDIEIALGSVGLDETAKKPPVTKWNDETLRFAKQSIQDLESGKTFKTYGLSIKDGANFQYKNKEDALGWLNYTIGYIYFYDKKDKKQGLPYIYKASLSNSDTKINPVVYESIGAFYYEDVIKLAKEVKTMIDDQKDADPDDVKQKKVDAIKAKVGILNGTAERALDAYARAAKLADPVKQKAYHDAMRKNLADIYQLRFGKAEGMDAWIASTTSKPLPDPFSPITPINDPEPATTTTTTTTPATPVKPPAKPPTGNTPAKPNGSAATTKNP